MSQGWPELILYPSGTEKLSGHGPGWYLRVPPNPLLALSCAPRASPHPLKETPATDPRMRGRGEMLGPPDSLQVEPFGEGPQHLPSCKHPLFLNRSPPGALPLPSSHPCTHGQVIWKSHASLLLSSRLPRLPKHFSEPGGHTQQQAEHTHTAEVGHAYSAPSSNKKPVTRGDQQGACTQVLRRWAGKDGSLSDQQ